MSIADTTDRVVLQPLVSLDNGLVYCTTPEAEAAWEELFTLYNQKAISAQAREVSRIYRSSEIRSMLEADHQPFGVWERINF